MENLLQFRQRTEAFTSNSLPQHPPFSTRDSKSLLPKVNAAGELLPYFGNTSVFLADESLRNHAQHLQDSLYERCADMLTAQRLSPGTFHMTLHDLVSGTCESELVRRMEETRQQVLRLMADLKRDWTQPIILRPTWVFNMVSASLVLGLEPVDEEHCRRLMTLYEALHAVVMPDFPYLTPHVTLAYFRPAVFTEAQLNRLRDALEFINMSERRRCHGLGDERTAFEFTPDRWVYREFKSMNDYFTRT